MNDFKNLKQELKNKERSISDLIRFIDTKTDHNPNYSILLGAGCSITSDIKSGSKLIELWKKEIYLQENDINENQYQNKTADEYFTNKMWFDSRNPYSSLFEKRYDLPRQRRMFIEQEVRDKTPSIGYAYLIKLVENNYFKTLFTTNFDDLLNEAFYQYSSERPIICAHDSSIGSITVSSKRPKIIKVHGDYLFDDIKSTLRETESLEENIKNKFIEFSKDYGLIIVGYGGNDRSIMDVLTYLLKNEDYFKNGIYWCLREDSEISEDLRKLLWKDRVYYVKIDGFDELMSHLNAKLNKSTLPIDSSFFNEKKDEIISKITSNKYLKDTKCKYIIDDFKKLNETNRKDIISTFFKYIEENNYEIENNQDTFTKKNSGLDVLSSKQRQELRTINEEIFSNNYASIEDLINKNINDSEKNSKFYFETLEVKAKYLDKIGKKEKSLVCYQELTELIPTEYKHHLKLLYLLNNYTEKIETIDKAINANPQNFKLYFEKAKIQYDEYTERIDKDYLDFSLESIIKNLNDSINCLPTYSNPAYYLKIEVLTEKIKDKNALASQINEILTFLEKQDMYYPSFVNAKRKYLTLIKKDPKEIIEYIKSVINKTTKKSYFKGLEFHLLDELSKLKDPNPLKERLEYIENTYEVDIDFKEIKAKYLLKKFDELDKSISTLESIKNKESSTYETLFTFYLYAKEFDKAQTILNEHFKEDKYKHAEFHQFNQEFGAALEIVEILKNEKPNNYEVITLYSYLLLMNHEFQKAYYFIEKELKNSNFTDPVLLINFYIATKRYKTLKFEKVKEKVINSPTQNDPLTLAAAYTLIEDQNNAFLKLQGAIKDNYSTKYYIKDWIIFEDLFKIERFKKLIS